MTDRNDRCSSSDILVAVTVNFSTVNTPSAFVVAWRVALVRVSVTVTVAPASGVPLGDATVPRTVPDVDCAFTATGSDNNIAVVRTATLASSHARRRDRCLRCLDMIYIPEGERNASLGRLYDSFISSRLWFCI